MLANRRALTWMALGAAGLVSMMVLSTRGWQKGIYRGKSVKAWSLQNFTGPDAQSHDEARNVLKAIGTNAIPDLIAALQAKDWFLTAKARSNALKLPPTLRRFVLRRLGEADPVTVRAAAARALGLLGADAAAAIPVLAQTLRDPEPQVSWDSATTLGRIGKTSVPVLIDALKETNPITRHAAVSALGLVGPNAEAAVPGLIECLSDLNKDIRASAVNSLASIRPPVEGLVDLIDKGAGSSRAAAVRELLRSSYALRRAVPGLLKMAQDTSPTSREQAMEALGALRATEPEA